MINLTKSNKMLLINVTNKCKKYDKVKKYLTFIFLRKAFSIEYFIPKYRKQSIYIVKNKDIKNALNRQLMTDFLR